MKRKKICREELIELLEEHKSVGKVSSHLCLPYSTVYAWYKKDNIDLPKSCMSIYDELREIGFSNIQKSVVLGSILGDGSLIKQRKSKNARLQIGHCTKQLGYLKWKKSLLSPFVNKITLAEEPGFKIINGKDSRTTGYYFINTIAHPDITEYYKNYYYKGKKRVIEDVIDELDLLGLSVWLADDGSFSFHGSKTALKGSIAICSFETVELEILIEALKKFFRGTISIDKTNNTLRLGLTKYINELLDMIEYVLPKDIHYKLVPQRLRVKPLHM